MKIDKLYIKNFKGFKEREFSFNSSFNVFIGKNGTGKTALLDALAVATGAYLLGIDEVNSRSIYKDEIRRASYYEDDLEMKLPVIIRAEGAINAKSIRWTRRLNSAKKSAKTTRIDARPIVNIAKRHSKMARDGSKVNLPVISYYSTGRLWKTRRMPVATLPRTSRLIKGYYYCLEPGTNNKIFLQWFKTREIAALQKRDSTQLDLVKKAISACIEFWDTVYFDFDEDDLMGINSQTKAKLPIRMLSDGQRNMVYMVADLAYRCVSLNPHLEGNALKETEGVVLVDEIDLHLHPTWQKRVVNDLKKTFPKIQFFATTHSAFIIQSLKEGELLPLDGDLKGDYVDKSIEDIAEDVQGVANPYWSDERTKMHAAATQYFKKLNDIDDNTSEEELENLKEELDLLSKPFAANSA